MSGPLEGKYVLITRPEGQAESLAISLEQHGAVVYSFPSIEIAPLDDYGQLDEALRGLSRFDWIVLTSVNGVRVLEERLDGRGLDDLKRISAAVIGPATGKALERLRGRPAEICPQEHISEAIAEALGWVRGKRFLLARADLARPNLAELLREGGAEVREVAAYRIRKGGGGQLPHCCPDYITLTSAEATRAAAERLKEAGHEDWLSESRLAAIGPITAAAIEAMGLRKPLIAKVYTTQGLVEAILKDAEEAALV
jgi:uroporphyrinogen-III synthase